MNDDTTSTTPHLQTFAPFCMVAARGRVPLGGTVSATMMGLLDRVWAYIRRTSLRNEGISVAMYTGDPLKGGEITAGVRIQGAVDISSTMIGTNDDEHIHCVIASGGRAAAIVHFGEYSQLGMAHSSVTRWCAEHGNALEGTSFEVYGHHEEDVQKRRTDVYYLLR